MHKKRMDERRAIELLKHALNEIPHLKDLHHDNQKVKLWHSKVWNIIEAGLDARDWVDFLFSGATSVDVRSLSDSARQKHYLEDLEGHETGLKSIIQKYELLGEDVVPPRVEENRKAGLEQFHDGLVRYKQLVLMPGERRVAANLEAEFQELWLELQRKYGDLKAVIEEYGNSTRVLLQGGNYECEAFTSAFGGYSAFSPEALEVVMDTAIVAVNTTISKLEKVLESEQLPREAVYRSDVPYNAYKGIRDIISLAAKRLIIVDPYVDSTLFNMLENVQPKVHIQILTRDMKGDFQLTGQKFKEQREKAQQGALEIRKSGKLHDRFIVADERVFQIGASLKDAGTKMCAINEFKRADSKTMLKKITSDYWAEAGIVL